MISVMIVSMLLEECLGALGCLIHFARVVIGLADAEALQDLDGIGECALEAVDMGGELGDRGVLADLDGADAPAIWIPAAAVAQRQAILAEKVCAVSGKAAPVVSAAHRKDLGRLAESLGVMI